ncbi:hypothetical protein AZI87_12480 [Bdellovibrio bacteriovorus]|uniref:Lipoprotein n=1 Tax=Bdellovibrio bacteriovorus TaxID=959 RepID=A0A162G9K2_BDEBC|nr:hypothetical protein [Bdellovibrio bacteriovorus]KYG65362.1 hypothetical protein AZI87_12480 [Bdellovibrio bacteriovorus]
MIRFMKTFVFLALVVLGFQSASARQLELPLQHPDEILKKTTVFSKNIERTTLQKLPKVIQKTASEIEIPFELGDGYYDSYASVIYRVFDPQTKKTVGYIFAEFITYTQDPEAYIVGAYVNTAGRRIGELEYMEYYYGPSEKWIDTVPEDFREQLENEGF